MEHGFFSPSLAKWNLLNDFVYRFIFDVETWLRYIVRHKKRQICDKLTQSNSSFQIENVSSQ